MENKVRELGTALDKAAEDLTAGDFVAAGGLDVGIAKVLFVETYPAHSGRKSLIAYCGIAQDSQPSTVQVGGNTRFQLATDAEVEADRETDERAKFITGLHEFADWLTVNPWAPIKDDGRYIHSARIQINLREADIATVTQVRELAERLGVKVDESLDDRTDASITIGSVDYSVIAWHKDGRPVEPAKLLTSCARCGQPLNDDNCPDECSCAAPDAERLGLLYTRADDEGDEPTAGLALTERAHEVLSVAPVSPARVPMHVGVVDDPQPVHYAAADSKTLCGLNIGTLPTGHGWTSEHSAIRCAACVDELPF